MYNQIYTNTKEQLKTKFKISIIIGPIIMLIPIITMLVSGNANLLSLLMIFLIGIPGGIISIMALLTNPKGIFIEVFKSVFKRNINWLLIILYLLLWYIKFIYYGFMSGVKAIIYMFSLNRK